MVERRREDYNMMIRTAPLKYVSDDSYRSRRDDGLWA